MGKHVLQNVEGFKSRAGEFYLVDPLAINVVDGWNHRTDFTGEEDLILSVIQHGVEQPLLVKKNTVGTLDLVDGERRLRAVLKAIDHGNDIQSVPVEVVKRGVSDHELYLKSFIRNDSKPPTPTEEATVFTRFIRWNFSVKDIATMVGRSESHIRNRLGLNNASPDVKKALGAGEISTTAANEITKEPNTDKQNKALEDKKKEPKKGLKPVTMFFDGNDIKRKGGKKNVDTTFLESVMNDKGFHRKLQEAGFNPTTLKISIEPLKES